MREFDTCWGQFQSIDEVEEIKVHEQLEGLFLHGRSRVISLRTRRLSFVWRIDVHQASST